MSQPNINLEHQVECAKQQARIAQAESRAIAQGIKPFNATDWMSDADVDGQTLEEREQEVDEFLKELREWRNVASQKELA